MSGGTGAPLEDRGTVRRAYEQSSKLRARQRLWSFGEAPPTGNRVNRSWPLTGDETLIDIGCGHGADLRALRRDGHRGPLIGVDLSTGLLSELETEVAQRANADATALPLRDSAADVVIAMHMLYHVEDIVSALREARRVLRPDGVFLASTNSVRTASELMAPWGAAMLGHGGPDLALDPAGRFGVENGGALLSQVFGQVELRAYEGVSRVPEARIIREYVASTDDLYEPMMPNAEAWTAVLDHVERHAQQVIDERGYFPVTARGGIFVGQGEAGSSMSPKASAG